MTTVFEHRESFSGDVESEEVYTKAYDLLSKTLVERPELSTYQAKVRIERIGDTKHMSVVIYDGTERSASAWRGLATLAFIIIVISALVWPWL